MNRSMRGFAAFAALGVLALLCGPAAFAQGDEEPSAERKALERVIEKRDKGNDAAAASQKRIDSLADETDDLLAKYRTTWKQIESIDAYNRQMRDLITAQERELASLSDQLERVQAVSRSVTPLMIRMIDALEQFVALDVPFLAEERAKRVADMRNLMNRADVTTAEKFRQIMEAYQIENEYGRTIEAYRSTVDIDGRETTVDFLRFGRIALVYQSLDEQEQGVWSQKERRFVPLDSSHRSALRQGLRIARKQAAPDLIRLPLPAPSDAKGAI
ncbi:MAG: DUF3450 domain-containing protein [Myxococcota bacterium]